MYLAEIAPKKHPSQTNFQTRYQESPDNPQECQPESDATLEKSGWKRSCWDPCFSFIFLFMENSSIHGFQHLTSPRRHWLEHVLWATVVCIGVAGSTFLSAQSWRRYHNDPTVIAFERDYKNWITSLPSGTLCSRTRFDEEKLEKYLTRFPAEKRRQTRDFLIQLSTGTYETFNELKAVNNVDIPSEDYMKVLYELNRPLIGIFKEGLWDQEYSETITEMGVCYAYNSEIAVYTFPEFFFYPMSKKIKPEGSANLTSGKPDGGYLEYTIKYLNDEVDARFVGANDVPDIATKSILGNWGDFTFLQFLAQSTTCSESVRALTFQQRKCRFMDESNLKISPVYSYNLCRMNCRWRVAQEQCKCSPHFYRKVDGVKTCDLEGLKCLGQNSDLLVKLRYPENDEKVKCGCLPTCEDNNYFEDDLQPIAWYNSTNFEWSIKKYPRIRFRRELIFGFTDLLISVGGVAGLCLGCSVLSFVEVFYFFTLRLFFHFWNHRKHT